VVDLKVTDEQLKYINIRLANDERRQMVDFTYRYIVREFTNESFEVGGRFYKGWW
jgi:hypothetical protein